MPKLPVLTPRKIIRILERKGFILDRVRGSHHIYFHPETNRRLSSLYTNAICRQERYNPFWNKQALIVTN